jgi:GTP1/Obg family GTP-binding protein
MNTQTAFEARAFEQANRISMAEALRLERAARGPSLLELAHKRIAELENERDQIYHDASELIRDLQGYFPGVTSLHDVFRSIERIEQQRDMLRKALQNVMHFSDAPDAVHHDCIIALNASKS